MRSFLFFLFTFLITGLAKAQGPTITSAEVAVPGDKIIYAGTELKGVILPGTGANVTWDYSGLVDSGDIEIDSFIAPSTTPYTALFPTANLALIAGASQYAYYLTNSSDWASLGSIQPGTDTAYYTKPFSNIHFPCTYGSSFSDSTLFIIHETGLKDTIKEVTVQQATGYGTLKLPGKTYTNVLQLKSQTIQRYSFGSFTSTSFLFATPGVHSYVMRVNLNTQNQLESILYVKTGVVITPTYTFTGNGNWDNTANWSGGKVPTSPVPSGTQVTINPQAGGSCILNVQMIFSAGSTLTIATGASFKVSGNLTIIN